MEAGSYWVVLVLLGSSALNAAYFLPIVYRAWFCETEHEAVPLRHSKGLETQALLLVPVVITGLLSLAAGVFAAVAGSPLTMAREIAEKLYLQ